MEASANSLLGYDYNRLLEALISELVERDKHERTAFARCRRRLDEQVLFAALFGPLKVLEVYEYYDGPRLFASVNDTGSVFLVLWVRTTGSTDEYYVQPMSFDRFREIRIGEISLRDAFVRSEGPPVVVLRIDRKSDEARITPLSTGQIDESLLPLEGEALKLESPLPLAGSRIVVPSISFSYARNGSSTRANALGMRPMQERAYESRSVNEQFH